MALSAQVLLPTEWQTSSLKEQLPKKQPYSRRMQEQMQQAFAYSEPKHTSLQSNSLNAEGPGDNLLLRRQINAATELSNDLRSVLQQKSFSISLAVHPDQKQMNGQIRIISIIAKRWKLDDHTLAQMLDFEGSRELSDLLRGRFPLKGRDRRERVKMLVLIFSLISSMFGNEEVEQKWLRTSQLGLHDRSPIQKMQAGSFIEMLELHRFVERMTGH